MTISFNLHFESRTSDYNTVYAIIYYFFSLLCRQLSIKVALFIQHRSHIFHTRHRQLSLSFPFKLHALTFCSTLSFQQKFLLFSNSKIIFNVLLVLVPMLLRKELFNAYNIIYACVCMCVRIICL